MFDSVILNAAFRGALSAVSLPLGALLGIWWRPPQKINSAFMAFGAGALLFALTIELFGHTPHNVESHGMFALFVTLGGALCGGLLFDLLNSILNDKGAFLRKLSQAKNYVSNLKHKRAEELLNELSKIKVLQGLSPEAMAQLLHTIKKDSFLKDDIIFKQGDEAPDMFFIIDGNVEIKIHGSENKEQTLAELGEYETFGELGLMTNKPRTADATAKEDTRVYKLSKSSFMDIVKKEQSLMNGLVKLADERVDELTVKTQPNSSTWKAETLSHINANDFSLTQEEIQQEAKVATGGGGAALAIWMGIFIDGIPESLIIGILALSPGGMSLAFIAGVFLANLPEAMSSSVSMQNSGMKVKKILLMWGSLTVLTALGAAFGAAIFPQNPEGNIYYFILGIEGLAAVAMLTMIAETMLPEAFEQGGRIIGFSTLLGFLTALVVKVL